ncbi:hypothetical protein H7I76_37980 [Mycolicibacterium vaccae]|nr:hypothetical protein [Mycolicibacterium vaccae]
MARHRSSKTIVLGAAAGAFLALATAPPVHADFGFDDIFDLFDPAAMRAAPEFESSLDSLIGQISAIDPSFMSGMQQLNLWFEDNLDQHPAR